MSNDPNFPSSLPIAPARNSSLGFNYVWDTLNLHWTPKPESQHDLAIGQAKESVNKFGALPQITDKSTIQTIWDGVTEYVFPSSSGESLIINSSNGTDNQSVIVMGLDENFEQQFQEITLSGTSDVNIPSTWTRVFRAYNNSSSDFVGDVSIKSSDGVNTYAKILSNNNQTLMCVYTIPANYTGKLVKFNISAHNVSSSNSLSAVVHLKTREYGKVFRTRSVTSFSDVSPTSNQLTFPIVLQPKTDIIFNKVSASATSGKINCDFDIALN
jgi:hypothetical protein